MMKAAHGTPIPSPLARDLQWLKVAFILHVLAALFSSGYLATDEHFQILEFLSFKWGFSPSADLATEFGLQARPFLQVAFYAIVAAPFRALGITDPFFLATLLRLCSAMLGMKALLELVKLTRMRAWIADPNLADWVAPLAAFLWFMPALHARTSQENIGGSLLVWGLCLALRGGKWNWALGGALLWAAAEIRFQLLAVTLPVIFGLVLVPRLVWRSASLSTPGERAWALSLGIAAAFVAARVADFWGYGQWTFPFIHYFEYNFLNQKLLTKVPLVVWDYYRSVTTETWPALGPLVLALFTLGWMRKPWHPIAIATAPLFLVHSFIAYKEYRFILPIAHFAPVMIPLALDGLPLERWRPRKAVQRLAVGLILWNLVALAVTTLTPARLPLRISEYISQTAQREPTRTFRIYTPDRDEPFRTLGLMMNFYRPKNLVEQTGLDETALRALLHPNQSGAKVTRPLWIFTRKENSDKFGPLLKQTCAVVQQSPPSVVTELLEQATWLHTLIPPARIGRTVLWECRVP